MAFVFKIAVTTLAVWVAVQLLDGLRYTGGVAGLVVIALVMALVNTFARPIVTFFSLPLVLLTLGLFLLVINALMFGLVIWISEQVGLGLTSTGFGATFIGALIVTIVSWIGEALLGIDD